MKSKLLAGIVLAALIASAAANVNVWLLNAGSNPPTYTLYGIIPSSGGGNIYCTSTQQADRVLMENKGHKV